MQLQITNICSDRLGILDLICEVTKVISLIPLKLGYALRKEKNISRYTEGALWNIYNMLGWPDDNSFYFVFKGWYWS